MIDPVDYFRVLWQKGFGIRGQFQLRPISDAGGATQRHTISEYVASNNINGHIVAISGKVYIVDGKAHVSAAFDLTSTLLKMINPLLGVLTVESVNDNDLREIIGYCRLASSLGPCTDYVTLRS